MPYTVGNRLKFVRTCLKISQKKFSEVLEVPLGTYANWEQSRSIPDLEHLIKIADKLYLSIDWLLGRENFFILYCNDDVVKKIYEKLIDENYFTST